MSIFLRFLCDEWGRREVGNGNRVILWTKDEAMQDTEARGLN